MITHHIGPTWIIHDNLPRWRPLTITFTKSLLHDLKSISAISTCISLGPYHSQVWELLLMKKLFLFGHKWYFLYQSMLRRNQESSSSTYVFFFLSESNFKNIILFIYFWLCWVFITVHSLSLVAVNGSYSVTAVSRHLLALAYLMEQRL